MFLSHSLTSLLFLQTHTELVEDSPRNFHFDKFTPGQEYCAVAHLASSPLSNRQCVYVPLQGKQCSIHFICSVLLRF